jgi:hypothetical protein
MLSMYGGCRSWWNRLCMCLRRMRRKLRLHWYVRCWFDISM